MKPLTKEPREKQHRHRYDRCCVCFKYPRLKAGHTGTGDDMCRCGKPRLKNQSTCKQVRKLYGNVD